MSDQCRYCGLKGDFAECNKTPCSVRDNWYVKQLRIQLGELHEAIAPFAKIAAVLDLGHQQGCGRIGPVPGLMPTCDEWKRAAKARKDGAA
jgi:hypothetical protein